MSCPWRDGRRRVQRRGHGRQTGCQRRRQPAGHIPWRPSRFRQVERGSTPSRQSSALGSTDREGAPQVPREPEVHHLAALSQAGSGRARPVGTLRLATPLPHRADEMGVPACDRPARARATLAAPDAEHHADDHERAPRGVRVDQRLRATGVEQARSVALAPLGMEVVHAAAAEALRRARHVAGTRRGGERRPCPDGRARLREQPPGSGALLPRRESRAPRTGGGGRSGRVAFRAAAGRAPAGARRGSPAARSRRRRASGRPGSRRRGRPA